jgi:hypothetical protein
MGIRDIKKLDYKKKENQDFKHWFWFCIANLWLPIAFVGFVLLILEIAYFRTVIDWVTEAFDEGIGNGIFVCPFLLLPLAIFGVTAYKGCYKHWKYVTTGDTKYNE